MAIKNRRPFSRAHFSGKIFFLLALPEDFYTLPKKTRIEIWAQQQQQE
jgi:hypothetical protein